MAKRTLILLTALSLLLSSLFCMSCLGGDSSESTDDAEAGPAEEGETAPDAADTTPPVISHARATDITKTSATVSWTTDEPSTGKVMYHAATGDEFIREFVSVADDRVSSSHSVELEELQPGMLYDYQIYSEDVEGNARKSGEHVFRTGAL